MEQNDKKDEIVAQLLSEGYSLDKIEKAYQKSRTKTIESIINIMKNEDEDETIEEEVSEPISSLVNQQLASDLQNMGFSKNVAEKSVFLTQNKGIEQALDYIDKHQEDKDFEEELKVVKKVGGGKGQQVVQHYTEEEKKAKLKQLQEKARQNRLKKEQEAQQEQERNRVRYTKEMQIAQQKSADTQLKIEFELRRKQKAEDEAYKKRLLEQMEQERQERLGVKQQKNKENKENKEKMSGAALLQLNIDQINLAHPNHLLPGLAANCYSTLRLYILNILKAPNDDKYRRINTNNNRFKTQVASTVAGVQFVINLGFQQDQEGYLVLSSDFDQKLLQDALQMINKQLEQQ